MRVINPNLQFRGALTPLNLNNVRYVVKHHIAGDNRTAEQIHQQHLNLGWLGAGYNEYIRRPGDVFIMRGDHVGAQVLGYNTISYGIGHEGNFDIAGAHMPQAQFDAGVERAIHHLERFPNARLVGHRDLIPTACPGRNFPWDRMVEEIGRRMSPDKIADYEEYVVDMTHWATEYFHLLRELGVEIHEERFDDNITRGESFAMHARILMLMMNAVV